MELTHGSGIVRHWCQAWQAPFASTCTRARQDLSIHQGMRPKKLPLSASCCVWLVCTSVLGRGLKRYCNTLTVFTEHLQFWQVGMTWDASMIGCYSSSVNDASCSDCLSFFGQSWSSMTPLRSLSWRRVNRLSTHLKCLFFI